MDTLAVEVSRIDGNQRAVICAISDFPSNSSQLLRPLPIKFAPYLVGRFAEATRQEQRQSHQIEAAPACRM